MDASLTSLPRRSSPDVLVGYENSDDAGVYLLSDGPALVQTVDFFSPIVDDPYTYGQIAAANALSDVYAMGGQPKTALSIVAFPSKGLDFSILTEIMKGGLSKLDEAGVALLGGHSVRDDEIKFGYAVTGTVKVSEIKQNKNARAGGAIVLTKPLGTGLITTAIKKGKASPEHIAQAVAVMTHLNRVASEIAVRFQIDTMTDISGFGLAGHALEVAKASNLSIEIDHRQLPILPGALEYSRGGFCAGGLVSNREFFSTSVTISPEVPAEFSDLIFDPQTSGGLLIFVPPHHSPDNLIAHLAESGIPAAHIGRTLQSSQPSLDMI